MGSIPTRPTRSVTLSVEINLDEFIASSLKEIEGVSTSLSEIFMIADAGLSFTNDHISENFDTIVSAIETFSVTVIDLCDNHISDNPFSDYNQYFLRCREFHSDLLKNLSVFKTTYKEQISLHE